MLPDNIIGWDLGGAHLKAAHMDASGNILDIMQLPCPLWKGIDYLRQSVDEVIEQWNIKPKQHAITMTGELVDKFSSRKEGVLTLVGVMEEHLLPESIQLFAGNHGFLRPSNCHDMEHAIASSNWLASASFISRHLSQALFIDIGSTTTDIIPVNSGRVHARGINDHDRLLYGEMVYSGVVRTPLMAMAQSVPFNRAEVPLMAEHFATSADVYRLLNLLPPHADQYPAADNGPKTRNESARRLARMIGLDLNAATMTQWCELAQYFCDQQLQTLEKNIELVRSQSSLDHKAPLVGAGVGRFLVKQLAERLGNKYIDLGSLFRSEHLIVGDPADCAPAVAVAWLARCHS